MFVFNCSLKFLFLFACFFVATCTLSAETSASYWETPFAQPYFDNTTKREITATVGQSALLHCRVRNLGDRAVSEFFNYLFKDKFTLYGNINNFFALCNVQISVKVWNVVNEVKNQTKQKFNIGS